MNKSFSPACWMLIVLSAVTVTLCAQPEPPAAPAAPALSPQQNPPPFRRPMPNFRGRQGREYQQTIFFLRNSKSQLEHSTNDFGGHRQAAIDACDKALQELQAVQTIEQQEANAKAAAARAEAVRAAQSNAAPSAVPASLPAPGAPPAPAPPQ